MKLWPTVFLVATLLLCRGQAQPTESSAKAADDEELELPNVLGRLVRTMQLGDSEKFTARLRSLLDNKDRTPEQTKQEALGILGDVENELKDEKSNFEKEVADAEKGDISDSSRQLRIVKKLLRRTSAARTVLENLNPKMVEIMLGRIQPSLEGILGDKGPDSEEASKEHGSDNSQDDEKK